MTDKDKTAQTLERIQANTLAYLDHHLADAATGKAPLSNGMLREAVQLIKANRELLRSRRNEETSRLQTMELLKELPDDF